ncbi:MAG TPA: valine--tRNA ligase [Planctomycetes bacterium]|nr:valine--tRNA ligase [Planctomycetota bacterium]
MTDVKEIPAKYDAKAAEAHWAARWEEMGIHRWDSDKSREETFVVDTPPPTVSGSLHIGHVFSYSHQDVVVRYQRMRGKNIAYPMGWDDNGLPTERRVQNIFGIRCDPKLPYDPDWKPRRDKGKKDPIEEVSRRNFIEACALVTEEDEQAFEELWKRLGLSIDWTQTYATIDEHCRRVSQRSFLDLVDKGEVYSTTAPTMWDVDFKTAVAQAEVEDRTKGGTMHQVRFAVEEGGELVIMTTRPELLAACIAVVAHPDDERYQDLFGKTAITPLFGARVPILAAEHADPEKGTGILMVCTFGDAMDVEWWKQKKLPLKQIIGMDGRLLPLQFGEAPFESVAAETANAFYAEIQGKFPNQARRATAELLAREGTGPHGEGKALIGEPEAIEHPVKFYEKGDRPLEFVPTRQWFIHILRHKEALLAQGEKIAWHPPHMRTRFDHWVQGLNQDWCISRQRYFGVPFPVWYPVQENGEPDYDRPIFADSSALPVDPLSDVPPGFEASQRNQPGGFMGDPDVMDTWATSSLTPQIVSGWGEDPARHAKLFPMDIRPQSHEIIRTWAFYTIVKAWMHENAIPWKHVLISGWILDPDRKKMSKSKGNVVTPGHLLDAHSVDGVRYWAARARPGTDTAFDETVFKVGKRLATKIFNAGRFVHMQLERGHGFGLPLSAVTEPLDLALLAQLGDVVEKAGQAFDRFDWSTALHGAEDTFWAFCDHYLELVKARSYDEEDSPGRRSALATLEAALKSFLKLLAPFLPYVTEEVWSWRFAGEGRDASIHTSAWPDAAPLLERAGTARSQSFTAAVDVLSRIRGAKSKAQKSLRWPVAGLCITASQEDLADLTPVLADLIQAANATEDAVELVEGAPPGESRFGVEVTLGETME